MAKNKVSARSYHSRTTSRQLVEQGLALLQVKRIEALGEPALDRGEKIVALLPLSEPDELDIATEDTIDLTAAPYALDFEVAFSPTHRAQVRPVHRRHLRCWRMAALDTQRPAIIVLPAPQPQATCVIMLSG